MIHNSILERIGNTSLIQLGSIVPADCARILLKVEAENPTGSMKDRAALAMIEAAESDGRLAKGGRVVEYTGGSLGVSLAMVCAVKGYPLSLVTSDAFSLEKRNHMTALGAELTLVCSQGGGMNADLTRNMVAAAREITEQTGGFLTDQLQNQDQLPAYEEMGNEIWDQSGGEVDAFVHMAGTTASVQGVAAALHEHRANIHCVAVEPSESPVLSSGESGTHKIEGVGAGFVVPLWNPDAVDQVATVSTEEAMQMCRRLAASEALFAGTSTGGSLAVAIQIGRRLGPGATVVAIMSDSGVKYLSTPVYGESKKEAREWSAP